MSEYITQKTAEQWNREELVIGRVGFATIRNFSIEVEGKVLGSPYTQLAYAYYDEFLNNIPNTSMFAKDRDEQAIRTATRDEVCYSGTVNLGFSVAASMLGYCTWAYVNHAENTGKKADKEELRVMLKNPEDRERLLGWFADVPNRVNRIRELYFGLKFGSYEHNRAQGYNPFDCFVDPATGAVRLQMQQGLMIDAIGEELTFLNEDETQENERCPAHGNFLSALWDSMADNICDNLTYFEPSTFGELQAAIK
ncbi:MAG TPA: hypothetical protein VLE69_02515 [Candidatus Saccharimonadales bacterium]|nr:hypothetical protein [Candidatus Saccharimonadales bacterium]